MATMSAKKTSKAALFTSIGAIVLAAVTSVAVLFGISAKDVTTKTLNNNDFKIGGLSEVGKVIESKESLVSKDFIEVDGMTIEVDEETATITYDVAFYNEDKEFISTSEANNGDFDVANVPENAKYCKISITPNEVDGEAVKLNVFNQAKYLKQITVTYSIE